MNEAINKKLIFLIRNAITGFALPDNFAITEREALDIYMLAKRHDIANIVYHAIDENNLICSTSSAHKKLEQEYLKSIRRNSRQETCLSEIEKIYNEEGIDYIPLKGSRIKKFYPESWMRTSSDIDILVRPEDYDRACDVMTSKLKYRYNSECGYHKAFETPYKVEIEVHNKINDEYICEFSVKELTDNTWSIAEPGDKTCYTLPDDYFYLYNILHMMRHFSDGGCGIRFYLDLWILNDEKFYKIDTKERELRDELLKKYKAETFEKQSLKLANMWFAGEEDASLTNLEKFVISAGTFGTLENKVKLGIEKGSGKTRYLLSRIFVSRDYLKLSYPVIEKYPVLTPVYEVRRWIRLLFDKDSRALKETRMLHKEGALSAEEFRKLKESMGI